MSFNFMAAVTICSDFGVQKLKSLTISIVSPSIWHEVMGQDAMIFIFCHKGGVICISEVIDISPSNIDWFQIFLGSKITVDSDCSHEIRRCLLFGRRAMTSIDSILRHYFADKDPYIQSFGFSSSHVWMWELDQKRWLSAEELMLLNCGVGEDSWECLGLQED